MEGGALGQAVGHHRKPPMNSQAKAKTSSLPSSSRRSSCALPRWVAAPPTPTPSDGRAQYFRRSTGRCSLVGLHGNRDVQRSKVTCRDAPGDQSNLIRVTIAEHHVGCEADLGELGDALSVTVRRKDLVADVLGKGKLRGRDPR